MKYAVCWCVEGCFCVCRGAQKPVSLDEQHEKDAVLQSKQNAIYAYQYMWNFPVELILKYLPTGLYMSLSLSCLMYFSGEINTGGK